MDSNVDATPMHLRVLVEEVRQEIQEHGKYRSKKRSLTPWVVSWNGARCALFLKQLYYGLHHLPRTQAISEMDWSREFVVVDIGSGHLATHDFGYMTHLVVLAHEHAIRAEIGIAKRRVELRLHPRTFDRSAGSSRSHPGLDALAEAVAHAIKERDEQTSTTASDALCGEEVKS